MIEVRDATEADLDAIRALYNASVDETTAAWTERRESAEERAAWFAERRAAGDPVLVAVDGDEVVGFCAWGWFRGEGRWEGYRHTKELSIHVADGRLGQGIGRRLLEALIERARASGVHVLVAAVDSANEASIRFHEALGFVETARMPEVGRKFDRWLDLVLLQRVIR